MGRKGGDATRLKSLMRLRWRGEIIPAVRVFYPLLSAADVCLMSKSCDLP